MSEPDGKYMSNESAQRVVWAVASVLLGIGWIVAYWVWPSGITDLPLASITFGELLRAIASGVIALITLGFVTVLVME